MLPLFAGIRLAENMIESPERTIWQEIISKPWLLCAGVVIASHFIAIRLAKKESETNSPSRYIWGNSFCMLVCWVVPGFFAWGIETQRALIETWTIGISVIFLLVSFQVPLKGIIRMLIPPWDTRKGK